MLKDYLRRTMTISHGIFVERPISALLLGLIVLLAVVQVALVARGRLSARDTRLAPDPKIHAGAR